MNRVRASVFLFFCLLFSLRAAEIKIICTADLHGGINRFAELAAVIRKEDSGDAVKIDIGDLWQGDFIAEHSGGMVMIAALNRLGFHFAVPGNHDFECSDREFAALCRRFGGAFLGGDWHRAGITGKPWVLVERNGIRCAIIGLTDTWMGDRCVPGSGMTFLRPYAALKTVMPEVLAARPHIIVLAWHAGIIQKGGHISGVLKHFPEIDIVLGGHSHEEHPGMKLGDCWFVQPGCRSDSAAVVEVRVDLKRSRITGIRSRLIRRRPMERDPEIGRLADEASMRAAAAGRKVLSRNEDFCRRPEAGEYDFPFGRFCAAALRRRSGADAAIFSLRADGMRLKAPLTVRSLRKLIPYRNGVWKVRLSRRDLEMALREELRRKRKPRQLIFIDGGGFSISSGGILQTVSKEDDAGMIILAVSDYILMRNRHLRKIACDPESPPVPCGFGEADAVETALLTALLPDGESADASSRL